MNNISFDKAADGIAVATIDMPGRAFNVFSDDMIDDLESLIAMIESDPELRGVVITSGKPAFMAGADLAMVRGFTTMRRTHDRGAIRATVSRLSYLLRRLERVPVTTVAAVNGLALGGGLELAMACHYRVAPDNDKPCLGLPEVLLGLLPGAGGTQRLPRLVGPELAARMLLDGKPVSPVAARDAGLVDRLAPAEDLLASARSLAAEVSAGARWDQQGWTAPTDTAGLLAAGTHELEALAWIAPAVQPLYPAIGAICRCLRDGYAQAMDTAIDVEIDNFTPLMIDPVAGNMVRTLFLSKTGAAKRASAKLGKPRDPASIALVGEGQLAPRLQKRLGRTCEPDAAELVLAFPPGGGFLSGDNVAAIRNVLQDPATSCTVELRTPGALGAGEVVEIAAEPGDAAGAAVGVVNRFGLVPLAVARREPGPLSRFVRIVRGWADECADSPQRRAAIANAVDMRPLFENCGLAVGDSAGYTDGDRTAGLDLMARLAEDAAACLRDGIAHSPEDLDVLAVVGLGFPAWSGGPLSFADSVRRGEIEPAPAGLDAGGSPFYPG